MSPIQLPQPVASLREVSKVFSGNSKKTTVLKDISFEVFPGELVLILGPSGSGKSTFLTILAGLQPPTTGEVRLFGADVHTYSSRELQRMRAGRIGFIFQTFHLIESLTALENILLVLKFTHTSAKVAKARALALLDRFEIAHLTHAYPGTMSQGEKQRVAVARALANQAELLIADEPTGSLATSQGREVVKLLHHIAKTENCCVVLASHDQRIIDYADRTFYIRDGELSL